VIWRIVRDALWDGHERKRLYDEALDFMKLRAERWKVARHGVGLEKKAVVAVPPLPTGPSAEAASESQGA